MQKKGRFPAVVGALSALLIVFFGGVSQTQDLPPLRGWLPANPSSLFSGGFPGGPSASDNFLLSSEMLRCWLPPIPNLQLGYQYYYGRRVSAGRGIADYLLPLSVAERSVVFGEAHAEFENFWRSKTGGSNYRVDLSFGGGYRTIVRNNTLLGVNGFYDTTKLGNRWFSSGGVGLEMASLLPGGGYASLNFNYYGNIFSSAVVSKAFRAGPANFDVQAAYFQPLFYYGPSLEVRGTGYKFDTGNQNIYGWKLGTSLWSQGNALEIRYEIGRDKIDSTYQSIGGFVYIPVQLERLARLENPFVLPEKRVHKTCGSCEPDCRSPLDPLLNKPVNRNYFQPAQAIVSRSQGGGGGPTPPPPGTCNGTPSFSACTGHPVNANSDIRFECFGEVSGSSVCNVSVTVSGFVHTSASETGTDEVTVFIARTSNAPECAQDQTAQTVIVGSFDVLMTGPPGTAFGPVTFTFPQGLIPFVPNAIGLLLTGDENHANDHIDEGWCFTVTFNSP